MSRQSADIDNPWQRLPWVLLTALLIWGVMLWGFGLLLGQIAEQSQSLEPIDAQFIELPLPAKHTAVSIPSRPKPIHQSPPQTPAPIQQPTSPPTSEVKPKVETLAPSISTPTVSVPETSLPSGNKAASNTVQPSVQIYPQVSPSTSTVSVIPPQFGAAYLNNPKPAYPASARRMGMEGVVTLKVLVSREGKAVKIDISRSSGYKLLDNAAAEAVKNWRFVPARQGETPIDEWVLVPVAFRLNK